MPKQFTERFDIWRRVVWRPSLAVVGGIYAAAAAFTFVRDTALPAFLSPRDAKTWQANLAPQFHFDWYWWVIGILVGLLIVVLEGVFRVVQRERADFATRKQGLEARIQSLEATRPDWSATEFRQRTIPVRDIPLKDKFFLRGRTFEDRLIQGPAVFFPIHIDLKGVQHGGDDRELVFAIPPGAKTIVGAIGLEFVAFINCRFEGIAFCVPQKDVQRWRDALAGRKDFNSKAVKS